MRLHVRSGPRAIGCLAVSLMLSAGVSSSSADVVTDWNTLSVGFVSAAGRPGPSGILDMAMVQIAVHDAVQAYQHRFQTYDDPIAGAQGSVVAAVATAAHDVLVARFASNAALVTSINTAYQTYLAANGLQSTDAGVQTGAEAALRILLRRNGDGAFPLSSEIFTGGTAPGQWRPTPPTFTPMAAPWLGSVTPFALNDTEGLLPEPPPPALTSGLYAKDYNEVKTMGARFGSGRTPEQTDLALFYSDNFVAQLNRAVAAIAIAHLSDVGDSARLFALANIAGADAIISSWDVKRSYFFWRPSTAIAEGDNDLNLRTDGDPSWLPLINNPPYPDYTSGANSITNAFMRTLSQYFHDGAFPFDVTSTVAAVVQKTRTYERFSDVADDVVNARIYLGIHFRFADTVARQQGKRAADWAFSHILRPLP